MKNILKITFLILFLSIESFTQTPTPTPTPTTKSIVDEFAYSEKVEQNYDRFKDSTKLQLLLQIKGQPIPFRGISAIFISNFESEKPPVNTPILLTMVSVNDDALYSSSHGLIFLLDSSRFVPISNKYSASENSVTYAGQLTTEQSSFILTQNDLKKIISAKKIEAQFGSTEFTFTDKQLESIRDFYKKLVP